MKRPHARDRVILILGRYKRLLGVCLFLGVLLAVFEVSGLRDHFNLSFIRQLILQHRIGGLVLFVFLFSLGNLIQIPGWVFLAAAVLTLGRVWGGGRGHLHCRRHFVRLYFRDDPGPWRGRVEIAGEPSCGADTARTRRPSDRERRAATNPIPDDAGIELRARDVGHQVSRLSNRNASRSSGSNCPVLHLFRRSGHCTSHPVAFPGRDGGARYSGQRLQ